MSVYKAINAVQAELAKSGISKDRENSFDKYKFRGIDDVYNALSPLLAKHGLCILPRILRRESVERETAKGSSLFYVTVEAEFDFVCAEDGSKHVVRTFGEAMDRGDKATNKAMSAAYKYAAFQAFAIPVDGDNDPDASSHEVKAKPGERKANGTLQGPGTIKATDGAIEAITDPEQRKMLDSVAAEIVAMFVDGKQIDCISAYYDLPENEDKMYVWAQLANESKIRSFLRANSPHNKPKEQA